MLIYYIVIKINHHRKYYTKLNLFVRFVVVGAGRQINNDETSTKNPNLRSYNFKIIKNIPYIPEHTLGLRLYCIS